MVLAGKWDQSFPYSNHDREWLADVGGSCSAGLQLGSPSDLHAIYADLKIGAAIYDPMLRQ